MKDFCLFKLSFILICLFACMGLLVGCPKPDAGMFITSISYQLYDHEGGPAPDPETWTPVYSKPYNTPAQLDTGKWMTFSMNVDSSSYEWSGFSDNPGDWTSIDYFRIEADTADEEQEILLYLDNIVVKSDTNTLLELDFSSMPSGVSKEQGVDLTNPDNITLASVEGRDCLVFHVLSYSQYGDSGGEIQFDLTGSTDFSGEDYTVSFDYYIETMLVE
jgi:hypothetical protein